MGIFLTVILAVFACIGYWFTAWTVVIFAKGAYYERKRRQLIKEVVALRESLKSFHQAAAITKRSPRNAPEKDK
jgi:hypothetical protein